MESQVREIDNRERIEATLEERLHFERLLSEISARGSVDLYIQNAYPGKGKEANWLPAPAGKFVLMLRLYWPKETPPSIIDGSWKPPAVKKVQ